MVDDGGFINVSLSSGAAENFFELNFFSKKLPSDGQTRHAKSFSQPFNLSNVQPLMKPTNNYMMMHKGLYGQNEHWNYGFKSWKFCVKYY